jgi:hypothetical protein
MTKAEAIDHRKTAIDKLARILPSLQTLAKNEDLLKEPMFVQIAKDVSQVHHFLQQVLA